MTVSESVRALILQAMRTKSISKKQLADALEVSNAWVTKLFNGQLLSLSIDRVEKLEEFLGIKFQRLVRKDSLPDVVVQLGEAMPNNAALVEIMSGLSKLIAPKPDAIHELPFFETKELRAIGAEVTKIVMRWEDAEDPHYGRIGREVVELLSKMGKKTTTVAAKKAAKKAPKK